MSLAHGPLVSTISVSLKDPKGQWLSMLFASNLARLLLVGFSAMQLRCGCDLTAMRSMNHFVELLA